MKPIRSNWRARFLGYWSAVNFCRKIVERSGRERKTERKRERERKRGRERKRTLEEADGESLMSVRIFLKYKSVRILE